MNPKDLSSIGAGALRAHLVRTIMTAAAITIGVGSVLLLTALGEGARIWVESQFMALGANVLIALPGRTETRGGPPLAPSTTRDLTLDDMMVVPRRLPGVVRMIPIVIGEAMAKYRDHGRTSTVVGSSQEFLRTRNVRMALGQGLPEIDPRERLQVCVIGRKIQQDLFGELNPLGAKIKLGDNAFRVIGTIVETGQSAGVNIDEIVLIPVANAMQIFNRTSLFRLAVEISSVGDLELAKTRLNQIIKERHAGEEDFTILTPGALAASAGNIIGMITMALTGIAAVSLAVAGIGVMNVMVVSVTERTGEVGLMKAVGASNGQVLLVFLSEAVILSAIGGVIGIAGGYALTQVAVWLYPTIPFQVPVWAVYLAVGISVAVGVAFGILPAARAARLEPVDALRKKV
jgi:putative ABC transport system permease protein